MLHLLFNCITQCCNCTIINDKIHRLCISWRNLKVLLVFFFGKVHELNQTWCRQLISHNINELTCVIKYDDDTPNINIEHSTYKNRAKFKWTKKKSFSFIGGKVECIHNTHGLHGRKIIGNSFHGC